MSVGETCPQIKGLTFIKGNPVAIGSSPEDKRTVVVVEMWATWCPPCRDSIPHLTELQHKYKDKDVYIVGVTDEAWEKAEPFVQGMGSRMDYTVALDTSKEVSRGLFARSGAQGIPHAFVIDHNHRIVYSGHPGDPKFEAALAAAAVHATERVQKKAYPPVTEPLEQLMTRGVRELKGLLQERGIDHSDCFEKADLAKKIVERCSQVTYYR